MFSGFFKGPSVQQLFNSGLRAYRSGDSTKAVNKLSEAIKKEKEKAEPDRKTLSIIHTIRGEVYLSEGVAVLSQSDFAYALEYYPENESALNNFGVWHSIEQFTTPDYKKSLEYFDMALTIRSDRKDIILNRACVKIKSGDNSGYDDLHKLDSEGYADAKKALDRYCEK